MSGGLLIDATPLQSEHRQRGVGAYLRELTGAIERSGRLAPDQRPTYAVSSVDRRLIPDALPVDRRVSVYRPHRPAQVYWTYNELALRAALARSRPAVFLAPDFNGVVPNPYGRTVAVLHDLTHLKLAEGETGGPAAPASLSQRLSDLRWAAYHRKLRAADRVIAVSQSSKRDAVRLLGLRPEQVTVVLSGVNHAHFRPSRGVGAYAGHPPYFVHIGGRNDNKNQARLLEAFGQVAARHPQARLYFAGPWSAADHAWLEAERTRLGLMDTGLGERVRHLGFVPDAELPGLYANAAAFTFPSLEEGFGLPVLEAMASGGAVITSSSSSLPEVAGDAALLIDPTRVDQLAGALERLLADHQLAGDLRARGERQAAKFTWEATAQATLEALRWPG